MVDQTVKVHRLGKRSENEPNTNGETLSRPQLRIVDFLAAARRAQGMQDAGANVDADQTDRDVSHREQYTRSGISREHGQQPESEVEIMPHVKATLQANPRAYLA